MALEVRNDGIYFNDSRILNETEVNNRINESVSNIGQKVLQAKTLVYKDAWMTNSLDWQTIDGLTIQITPTKNNSKFIVICNMSVSVQNASSGWGGYGFKLQCNGQDMNLGTDTGHNFQSSIGGLENNAQHLLNSITIIDTYQNTDNSQKTFTVMARTTNSYRAYVKLNGGYQKNTSYTASGISSIVVLEVEND